MKIERINKTFIITLDCLKFILWRFAIALVPMAPIYGIATALLNLSKACDLICRHFEPKLGKWAEYKQKGIVVT